MMENSRTERKTQRNAIVTCATHPGRKKVNQDSVLVLTARCGSKKRQRQFAAIRTEKENSSIESAANPRTDESSGQEKEIILAAVCDGMGGHARGEIASWIAVQCIEQWFRTVLPGLVQNDAGEEQYVRSLDKLFGVINEELLRSGKEMGTTAACLLLAGSYCIAAHIGDSRIYALNREEALITCDHSWVMEEVKAGRLRPEEIKNDPRRNILIRCLGITEESKAEFRVLEREENTIYLVCTDGFWRENDHEELRKILADADIRTEKEANAKLQRLIDENMSRGETDNMSAIWLRE